MPSSFRSIILSAGAIIVLLIITYFVLGLISDLSQNWRDAILVMLGALFGNMMWEILKKGMDG
jgi:predicted permease